MGKHYVVYEGHTPGVYDSWAACKRQVHGFSGNSYCSYPTKVEAEREYERYVSKKKDEGADDDSKVGFQFMNAPGSSAVEFAAIRDIENELMGITIQNWLARISWTLLRAEPIYSKHGVIEVGGIEYTCYNVNVVTSTLIGDGSCTIGRYGKGDFLAREDAALIFLRRLLAWTNRDIVDFNYFNVKDVEAEKATLEAHNIDLMVENEKLKKEIKMLKRKFNV
ncbi:hypothetical protein RIF29_14728 [Crotalaria pallida]|uniref:Ribonuclease H1 N-terminal domain-containing protein n=1 Tax=Crotalaria pallida TaxID=3830 RepID=A0AAN9IE08_CROPI